MQDEIQATSKSCEDVLKKGKHKKVTFDDIAVVLNESNQIGPPTVPKSDVTDRRNTTCANSSSKRPRIRITTKLPKTSSIYPVRVGTSIRQVQRPGVSFRKSLDRGDCLKETKTKPPTVILTKNGLRPGGNVYDKPELHTALQVAERLQMINLECFDPVTAVQKKLDTSPGTKKTFIAASTRPVNIPFSKIVFPDPLPLEFDAESLLLASAKEREAKMRAAAPVARSRDPQPVLEEFLTDDLQPEFVAVPLPSLHFPALRQPCLSSNLSAYSLYKHKRMWEGLP